MLFGLFRQNKNFYKEINLYTLQVLINHLISKKNTSKNIAL